MINLTLEKKGSHIVIFGYDEYKISIRKEYYYFTIANAVKDFKSFFDLKHQRNVNIKKEKDNKEERTEAVEEFE